MYKRQALLREPRAEGATRIRPSDLGRVLGLDRAPEVKTLRRKLAELAAAGQGAALQAALGAHHAATRPDAVGFLYLDGHVRVYTGTRQLPKTNIARIRIAGPATEETWVSDTAGEYPPRSNTTVQGRLGPIMARRSGSNRASSAARDAEGGAVMTMTGSPCLLYTSPSPRD